MLARMPEINFIELEQFINSLLVLNNEKNRLEVRAKILVAEIMQLALSKEKQQLRLLLAKKKEWSDLQDQIEKVNETLWRCLRSTVIAVNNVKMIEFPHLAAVSKRENYNMTELTKWLDAQIAERSAQASAMMMLPFFGSSLKNELEQLRQWRAAIDDLNQDITPLLIWMAKQEQLTQFKLPKPDPERIFERGATLENTAPKPI